MGAADLGVVLVEAGGEGGPGGLVVVFAGGAVEGGFVSDRAFVGAAKEGVVGDGAGDGGVREVADVLSAEGEPVRVEAGVWRV